MNLPLHIALRYLFSKKSHQAVNWISLVSVLGVAAATLAMLCTLSAFNGFRDLMESTYRHVDPDLKVTSVKGKSFRTDSEAFRQVAALPGLTCVCPCIEDNVLLRYKDSQTGAVLKGVDSTFHDITDLNQCLRSGRYTLGEYGITYACIGAGLASTLGTGNSFIDPIWVYSPRRKGPISLASPSSAFRSKPILIAGSFFIGQDQWDDGYLIVPIAFARNLLEYAPEEATALELKLAKGASPATVKRQVSALLGSDFRVADRREQEAGVYRIHHIERWVTFFILCFILLIALFNVIGSLSMLILEKQADTRILSFMGADRKTVRKIFLHQGWLISIGGALTGLLLGSVLCLLQQHFGLLKLGSGNFIIDAYPVRLQAMDILLVLSTVLLVSLPAVWWPVHYYFRQDEA